MEPKVVIVDYKMGNVCSVEKALDKIGVAHVVSAAPKEFENATHAIIPGVGHYATGMKHLEELGLISLLKEFAKEKPLLGICLGMQLLFKESEEAPGVSGLGLIDGKFKLFQIEEKVPHVGWNDVNGVEGMGLFEGIEEGANFYFVHSYYCAINEDVPVAHTAYGVKFVSAVTKENVMGTQFHPEKSQKKGIQLLRNFVAMEGKNA